MIINIAIDIGDLTEDQVHNKFAIGRKYQDIILVKNFQVPNPETKAEFFNREVGRFVQGTMHSGAVAEAIIQAADATPKPIIKVDGRPVEVQPVPVETPKDVVPAEEVPAEPVLPQ